MKRRCQKLLKFVIATGKNEQSSQFSLSQNADHDVASDRETDPGFTLEAEAIQALNKFLQVK